MLKQSLVSYLIRRYLRFNKTQPFISITAILAFLGVSIGVMVLIVAMALMNGFDKEFERKLFIMNYPITMVSASFNRPNEELLMDLEKNFKHLKFSPFIQIQALSKANESIEGAMVFGVDFERESAINPVFNEALLSTQHTFKERLGETYKPEPFQIIIGKTLKEQFRLRFNSNLLLIFTQFSPTAINLTPTMKRFEVVGVFNSGLIAYDKGYIYTTLEALQTIKTMPQGVYDGIHIYSKNPQKDIIALKEKYPYMHFVGWWEQNGNFFAALELEKRALFIVLMLIILVASLNIISSLLMTVMNRRKEIALLLTMGASTKEIKKTFLYLGNVIGVSGILVGAFLAAIILFALANFPIISLPADVYGSDKLPLDLSLIDLGAILIGSFVIVFLSSYYPAKKATQIDPLQVLRNE
ncbi:ABC transporter permease [Helicobacter turcicus]|uniref:ABC transporter permease n=1 Tax=Helicobacter turcicus TaxID=2867412 RepID=A0ABS7JLH7_9HELI|nr:ABC transporter permease [Helicobacter turcicus]MBX7490249.1 ABC transporter permease [Helicobacter turcicus]MBX7545172.1 ABC transporter permease [Helicobacter turcicus]